MTPITTIAELESHYGAAHAVALTKVTDRVTQAYRRWIEASRFCILSTVGPEGTDGTPRGDDGPVVTVQDERTLLMPDWQGNNRLDSLRNIVRDGRVSLMFLVPGRTDVVRVNGTAQVTADADLRGRFDRKGMHPATVVVFTVREVYFQCGKALLRSDIWNRNDAEGLPSAGELVADADRAFSPGALDEVYDDALKSTMW